MMGYILPVTNFQYMQYAEREIGTVYDPFHIGKISRIKKEDPVEKSEDQALSRMQKAAADHARMDRIYKKRVNPVLVSQTYAELTGKGKHYSESI
jgi:hypothetical protein